MHCVSVPITLPASFLLLHSLKDSGFEAMHPEAIVELPSCNAYFVEPCMVLLLEVGREIIAGSIKHAIETIRIDEQLSIRLKIS